MEHEKVALVDTVCNARPLRKVSHIEYIRCRLGVDTEPDSVLGFPVLFCWSGGGLKSTLEHALEYQV